MILFVPRFLEGGGLALDEARDGEPIIGPNPLPASATRNGPVAGEGTATAEGVRNTRSSTSSGAGVGVEVGVGTGPSARPSGNSSAWIDGAARRREARREEAASQEWISSTRADVGKLCDVAAKPFWQVCPCLSPCPCPCPCLFMFVYGS